MQQAMLHAQRLWTGPNAQGLRFLVVGGLAALLNWLVRFPLSAAMPFAAAVATATAIGMVFGFFAYNLWVFPGSTRSWLVRARDFIGVNLVSLVVVTAVATGLEQLVFPAVGMTLQPEAVAHATGILVGAVLNFVGHKFVTYRA